jgi:DNA repair protein RecO (recombination protein O)
MAPHRGRKRHYTYRMEQGPVRLEHDTEAAQVVSGKTLLDLEAEDFSDPRSRQEAKA